MAVERRSIGVTAASGRHVPVDLTHPEAQDAGLPLIVFSHGANAAPDRYRVLLDAWAQAGFVVAAPLHVDSEDHPDRALYDSRAIRAARAEDYEAVDAHFAAPSGVIAIGHSYGALIAQMPGIVDATGWSAIDVPTLTVTGDRDIMPGFVDKWEQHLAAYHAQNSEQAYALLFGGMDHYFNGAFGRLKPGAAVAPVDALNGAILSFARDCLGGDGPTAERWLSASTPGMRATTRRA
jgi:dienelactone hydrolase